ncbi:hypothetical protein [Haladaptatus sp. NG-SE-30]
MSTLRNASERATVPLTEMQAEDVDDLLALLVFPKVDGGYGLDRDGGGMFNYTRVLRLLFQWMNERDEYGTFPFWDDIKTPKQTVERQDEDERLHPDEVKELKRPAKDGIRSEIVPSLRF